MSKKLNSIISVVALLLCALIIGNLFQPKRDTEKESTCEHVYGAAVTVRNPTCEEEGAKKMECLICGEIHAETIPSKGGHMYVDKEFTVSPTCLSEGVVKRQCLLCSNTIYDRIPKTENHTFDLGVEMEDYMLYTCTLCGFTKQGEIHYHKDADFDGKCDGCGNDYDVFAEGAYTEVDVADGEYVAGNWYRFYRPDNNYYSCSFNVELVGSSYETFLDFYIKSSDHGSKDMYISYMGEYPGNAFDNIKSHITDEYIDVYFAIGTYSCPGGTITAEITEETTISIGTNGAYIKRLQINE